MRRIILSLLPVLILALVASPAFAQKGPGKGKKQSPCQGQGPCENCPGIPQGFGPGPHGPHGFGPPPGVVDGVAFENRLKELRNKMLTEKVGLSDRKMEQVVQILDKFDERDKEAFKKLRSAHLKLEALMLDGEKNQVKYMELIDEIMALQDQKHKSRQERLMELRKVMTPEEQAKFITSLMDARKKFRRHIKGGFGPFEGDENMPPPPPPER